MEHIRGLVAAEPGRPTGSWSHGAVGPVQLGDFRDRAPRGVLLAGLGE
jgi:hypothetical protein